MTPSENECRYLCDTGFYPFNGQCVLPHLCEYDPCSDVNNVNTSPEIEVCMENDYFILPYTCECEDGFYWHGKTGCRDILPRNMCTGVEKCFDNEKEINCPLSPSVFGEYNFFGQDAQYAEMGYCTPKNFVFDDTVADDITVIDKNTGLEWQKESGGYKKTWDSALSYCDTLEYGGHADWRLPSIKELMTIVNYNKRPKLDVENFDADSKYYMWWSSTEYAADNTKAWYFDSLGSGDYRYAVTNNYTSKTNTERKDVHCVRGTSLQENSFSFVPETNNKVVKDSIKNLYWQKGYESRKTWQEALKYCEDLTEGGYSDWRMPNISELLSIADYEKTDPAIDSDYFDMPNYSVQGFWSSTTAVSNNGYAQSLSFKAANAGGTLCGSGTIIVRDKSVNNISAANIRCVRSDLCNEGEFLQGKNCVTNPCSENSCSMEHSDGKCTPLTAAEFSCGCEENYFWDGSNCVSDPCSANECDSIEGSDGFCTPIREMEFRCGCIDGYFWNGSRCMTKHAFGNICTGQTKYCTNNTGAIDCPASVSESGNDYNFYGQDAQYAEKGGCVSQSFTINTPDNENPDQKIITDNNTWLEWTKNIADRTFTFNQAVSYCSDLEYGGKSDWRLPTLLELSTIVNIASAPYIDNAYFGEVTGIFWTSNISPSNSLNGVSLNFDNGSAGNFGLGNSLYVRCVRGNPLTKNSSFSDLTPDGISDIVVKDNITGLIWQKNPVTGKTWQQALEYCEKSEYAGFSDWRLPNRNELLSLNPNRDWTDLGLHWSSSSTAYNAYNQGAFGVVVSSDSDNSMSVYNKNSSFTVRCVR